MFCCRHFYCVRIEPHWKHRSIEFLTTQTDQSKGDILIDYVLIANLYGPVEGKRHEAGMLADSGLLNELQQFSFSPRTGLPLCIYGDPGYPLRGHLQAPFRGNHLTQLQKEFNKSMSSVRVSVEWIFGDNYFKFIDFKKNLKIGLSSVGKMYLVCGLLQNAHTCLYRNTTCKDTLIFL